MNDQKKSPDQPKNPTNGTSGINTILAHSGHDPHDYHGYVNPPVVHASTILYSDTATMLDRTTKYNYAIHGTPTSDALANLLSEIEGAVGTVLVPSGLAAITLPLLAFTKTGDHVLIVDTCYQPTRRFCNSILAKMGIEIEYFDPSVGSEIGALLKPNTSVVLTESPGTNTFEVMDIPAICQAAHESDAIVMTDNTWATPIFFKPLDFGVDLSIHALTKYPAGHSDLLMGSVSANERTWKQLVKAQDALGVIAAPDDCYRVFRGLKTMGIRLERHQTSALEIAHWLQKRPEVSRVLHPALSDNTGHELWKRDFTGSSGLFSIVLDGYFDDKAARFLDALQLFGLGSSWGGFESLARLQNTNERTITKGPEEGALIRLQIGLEDVEDLVTDLERGFAALQ